MNRLRGFALLAVATAASALMVTPAQAAGKNEVRYGWVGSCAKKDYTIPCGPWHLALGGGKDVVLKDAVVYPTAAGGKIDKESSAPISISGDGRFVGYFRASDRKLVVRDIASGSVKALPGKAAVAPKSVGMVNVDPTFSPDGRRVVVDYYDDDSKLPSLLVDLATGAVHRIPGNETVQGFSPDGSHLLTTRGTDDNTTEMAVYDESGAEVRSKVVPQVVANNAPIALADDGVTVGLVIVSPQTNGKTRLRTYDLSTDGVSDAVTLRLPTGESPTRLVWSASGEATLWTLKSDAEGNTNQAVKRSLNTGTGATAVRDSFRIKSGIWTWWLPGD
ncbi:TolB family protein [Nonomuraea sp. NPDC059194]|uniref:TolB family protein n=1 Tax=Nonomuraea sp. NPDC059194 TaxID=3346764 RepID=UPI0036997925